MSNSPHNNPYASVLQQELPRLLNCYNTDRFSHTYGYGDRLYWGWKVSDFANATYQGGVHALAVALKLNLVGEPAFVRGVIDAAIRAVGHLHVHQRSIGEAYPQEHSFCVNALVAFDVLSAVDYLWDDLVQEDRQAYVQLMAPLIDFITRHDEEHAIISNHLATAVAAMALWNKRSGFHSPRGDEILKIIYKHQSEEGWYKEYEGADPGYQTLCTYYLASAYTVTKDAALLDSLQRSARFLHHFVQPDGTIGGLYGSRNTEVYYPGGVVALAGDSPEFALMARHLAAGQHVLPSTIDSNNYIPLLNAYACAAVHYEQQRATIEAADHPVFHAQPGERQFPEAGLYLKATSRYFAVVNYKKGGTLKVFDQQSRSLDTEDGGLFGRTRDGKKFSSQQFDNRIDFQDHRLVADFYALNESSPTPFHTIILRVLALTMFRSIAFGNWFKKMIVKLLMTGKKRVGGRVERQFEFGDEKIVVKERIFAPGRAAEVGHFGKAKAIHMASSGYYHPQVEQTTHAGRLVEWQEA